MNYIVPNSSASVECVEFRQTHPRDQYGRLVLGPLAPGQGITLGNTFRRIMLNDLAGVAITAAKINNARTEFTTLPGIRESVVEIFLNLREITFFNAFPDVLAPRGRLSLEPTAHAQIDASTDEDNVIEPDDFIDSSDDPLVSSSEDYALELSFQMRSPRVLTAGDLELPPGIECVDPTQPIATIVHEQAVFDLTFILEQGTGYRVWKKPTQPLGGTFHPAQTQVSQTLEEVQSGMFQPIDGNFMPVKTVNFSVHDMSPAGEYIHFEITTNGSLHPKEAFRQAGAVLAEITQAVVHDPVPDAVPEFEVPPVSLVNVTKETEYFHNISIEELELSLRAYNCLKRAQILTLSDLSRQTYQSLLKLRNFGQKSAEEVRKALETYGIQLVQDFESVED